MLKNRHLVIQLGISFVFRLAGAGAAFVSSLFVSRLLGATESGQYFLAFAVVSFLAAFSRMGLDNTVLKHVGAAHAEQNWAEINSILTKSFLLAIVLSIVTSSILFLFSNAFATHILGQPQLAPVLKIIAPAILSISCFTLAAMALQGMSKIIVSVFSLNICVNIVLILLLLTQRDHSVLLTAKYFVYSSYITVLFSLVFLFKSTRIDFSNSVTLKTVLTSCLPLWVVIMMQQLTLWSGQLIAAPWVSSSDIAHLAVAQRTAMLTSFILMAVNFVVAPKFAAMHRQSDLVSLEKLAKLSVKIMALISLPILIICIVTPNEVMSLFGEDFSSGGNLLTVLAIGQFINVITGSVGYLLIMSGHEKDFRNTVLASGFFAVLLPIILVPQFGIIGSAFGTAFAVGLQNLGAVYWVKKRLGFNTLAVWK